MRNLYIPLIALAFLSCKPRTMNENMGSTEGLKAESGAGFFNFSNKNSKGYLWATNEKDKNGKDNLCLYLKKIDSKRPSTELSENLGESTNVNAYTVDPVQLSKKIQFNKGKSAASFAAFCGGSAALGFKLYSSTPPHLALKIVAGASAIAGVTTVCVGTGTAAMMTFARADMASKSLTTIDKNEFVDVDWPTLQMVVDSASDAALENKNKTPACPSASQAADVYINNRSNADSVATVGYDKKIGSVYLWMVPSIEKSLIPKISTQRNPGQFILNNAKVCGYYLRERDNDYAEKLRGDLIDKNMLERSEKLWSHQVNYDKLVEDIRKFDFDSEWTNTVLDIKNIDETSRGLKYLYKGDYVNAALVFSTVVLDRFIKKSRNQIASNLAISDLDLKVSSAGASSIRANAESIAILANQLKAKMANVNSGEECPTPTQAVQDLLEFRKAYLK